VARFSNEVIYRIKSEISLIRVIERSGVDLQSHGKDKIGRCPFHDDKTPSLVISPESNLWHCMGACQCGGSVIDWVMKTQGVNFRLACEILQKDLGLITGNGEAPKTIKRNTKTKLSSPFTAPVHPAPAALAHPCASAANANHQESLRQVIDYYHETLKTSPEAQAYLRSRGLDNPELIARFKIEVHHKFPCKLPPSKLYESDAKWITC
jgi:DNA primase